MEPKKIHVIQIKASSGDMPRASVRVILRIHCHGQVTILHAHPCPTVAIFSPLDLPLHTWAEKLSLLDSRLEMLLKRKSRRADPDTSCMAIMIGLVTISHQL